MSRERYDVDDNLERAVIDRILDGTHVVLLVGGTEEEQVIPADHLPDHATEGSWLLISRDAQGEVVEVEVDEQSTEEAEERIISKLDTLRRRGRRHSSE